VHELEHLLGEGSVYIEVNPAPTLRPRQTKPWEKNNGD
jgi:hypothetical protein